MITYYPLNKFLMEYTERNSDNEYRPVAVGRYGIRTRESIYSKELAKDYSKNKLIYKDTLTVGMGSVQIDIGVLSEDVIYSVSPAYHTYRIEGINSEYLKYCLECRNRDMFVRYVKKGSRQGKTIDLKRWLTYEIPVCSEIEQKQVVEKISYVNALIEVAQTQLAKLDELVKARFVEMFGDPVRNDKGWPLVPLASLAEIKIGPFGSLLHKEDYVSGGHALVNPSHIVDGQITTDDDLTVTDSKYAEMEAYHLHTGDIVLGRRGEMGRCAVVYEEGMLCGTGSLIIRPASGMLPYFLQKIISYPTFKKSIEDMAVGVTMLNLNVPIVSGFMIPVLPLEEQTAYLEFVEQTDKSKLAVQQSLEKLETLKKSLMQQYFG